MPLVAILSNKNATTNRRKLGKIRDFVEATPNLFHVEVQRFDEVPKSLEMIARVNPDLLVINGGDGTVIAAFSSLVNDRPFGNDLPPIAVLTGGKTNMIAADLGMKGAPIKELKRLLD
ncbi:MAG: diacylglycerol kinase, partial [Alphaproteobacteria bacterium]